MRGGYAVIICLAGQLITAPALAQDAPQAPGSAQTHAGYSGDPRTENAAQRAPQSVLRCADAIAIVRRPLEQEIERLNAELRAYRYFLRVEQAKGGKRRTPR